MGETRFEPAHRATIAKVMRGKVWAYRAVMMHGDYYLAVVVEGVVGYRPMVGIKPYTTREGASHRASELNLELGLSPERAAAIQNSTLAKR